MRIVYHNPRLSGYSQYGHYHWRYSWGYDDFIPAGAFKRLKPSENHCQTISVQPHGFSGPDSESGHRGPHEGLLSLEDVERD